MAETDDPFASLIGQPEYAKPGLRNGLRRGQTSRTGTEERSELVDAKTGNSFSFSAAEAYLLVNADGKTPISDLFDMQLTALDKPLTALETIDFFRRIKILGLLESAPAVPEPAYARPKSRSGRIAATRTAGGEKGDAEPSALPMDRSFAALRTLAADRTSAAAREKLAAEQPPEQAVASAPTSTSRRRAAVSKVISQNRASVKPRADAAPASALTASAPSVETKESAAVPAVPQIEVVDLPAPNKRPRRMQRTNVIPPAPPAYEEPPAPVDVPPPLGEAAAAPDPFDTITATLRTAPVDPLALSPADLPSMEDDFGELLMPALPRDDIGGRFGGRFGGAGAGAGAGAGMGAGRAGGMGGFGGGMGGGGMGGGGMGGGGMGGGPNAERIMAMIAARRGGGGAGGAPGQGMRPDSAPADAFGETRPMGVTLLNPTWLLRLLYILLFPARYLGWLTVPAVVFAGLTVLHNWPAYAAEFVLFQDSANVVVRIITGLLTVNLASRLAQGCAIIAGGGQVRTMGIALDFGFLPRFFVDISSITKLSRQGQLWAWGTPILARYWLFALGTVLWAVTRNSGTWFSHYAFMVGQFSAIMAMRSSLPVLPGDGQRFLATFFNDARLLSKSMLALRHALTGRKLPAAIPQSDILPLAAFGAAVILSSVSAFVVLTVIVATQLEISLGGFGVFIFLTLAALSLFYFITLTTAIRRRVEGKMAGGLPEGFARELMAGQPDAERADSREAGSPSGAARIFWVVLLIATLSVAFLPYEYDSGGVVEVLPAARAQAVARTDGEILEVLVREGELVSRDQVLARTSSWEQENGVNSTAAQLGGAEAQLNKLMAGAKVEEIDLAQKQVDSARSSLALSKGALDRADALLKTGTSTQKSFDEARSTYEEDLANLAVAEAQLELVRSGATPEEVAIAQSDVDRLKTELAFRRDEMERTSIRAPMEGRVVTPNLDLLRGKYLRTGESLIEIERAEVIKASIAVPEADIGLIKVGATVRLKAWGDSDREILGVVESVGSAAVEQTSGSVVQVLASFDNTDGLLRSNMTGYAKIDGGEMTVWRAYLRSLTRFFQIEVWSWIP